MTIYHITSRAAWQAAQRARSYASPTLTDVGFIHASTREQVIQVANAFYRGQDDLVLLVIDVNRLQADVRWEPPDHIAETDEPPPEQGLFPHIYGPINLTAVTDVLALTPDSAGLFVFPSNGGSSSD